LCGVIILIYLLKKKLHDSNVVVDEEY
jgi:hypothetical protein